MYMICFPLAVQGEQLVVDLCKTRVDSVYVQDYKKRRVFLMHGKTAGNYIYNEYIRTCAKTK